MNPFIQRGRISEPQHFIGRWRELAVVFDYLAAGRPVLITGTPGIGKASLLTHVAQSAAVNLKRPELEAFYMDLAVLPDASTCYELMSQGLGNKGNTAAAIQVALLQLDAPVLCCLDNAESAVAAGWGSEVLERLARIARTSTHMRPTHRPPPEPDSQHQAAMLAAMAGAEPSFLLVATFGGPPPALGEPFSVLSLGAFSPAEVRLFADAYLEGTGVQFTPEELRELSTISVGHPAYLQRAAFHLFRARKQPDYDWHAAYFAEAQERPVPGAPLPPAVFEGSEAAAALASYGYPTEGTTPHAPERVRIARAADLLTIFLPLIAGLLAWQIAQSWLIGLLILLAGFALAIVIARRHG